jgi:hypothetical protein
VTRADRRAKAIAKAVKRLEELNRQLAMSLTYSTGKYAELGITPTTPCVVPIGYSTQLRDAVAVTNLGPRPRDARVCHRCSTPDCITPDHLFYGTSSDMVRDAVLRGKRGKPADPVTLRSMIAAVEDRLLRYTS